MEPELAFVPGHPSLKDNSVDLRWLPIDPVGETSLLGVERAICVSVTLPLSCKGLFPHGPSLDQPYLLRTLGLRKKVSNLGRRLLRRGELP